MLGDDEELIDFGSNTSVLEAEDVDEAQVPDRSVRLYGHPDGAKARRRQQSFQLSSHGIRLKIGNALELPVLGNEH